MADDTEVTDVTEPKDGAEEGVAEGATKLNSDDGVFSGVLLIAEEVGVNAVAADKENPLSLFFGSEG